jgi:hypothetical protein
VLAPVRLGAVCLQEIASMKTTLHRLTLRTSLGCTRSPALSSAPHAGPICLEAIHARYLISRSRGENRYNAFAPFHFGRIQVFAGVA